MLIRRALSRDTYEEKFRQRPYTYSEKDRGGVFPFMAWNRLVLTLELMMIGKLASRQLLPIRASPDTIKKFD